MQSWPRSPNLPVQPVPRRPSLEADIQAIILPSQLPDRPLDRFRPVLDLTEKPDLAVAAALSDRDSMLQLRYVECDIGFVILSHGSPAVLGRVEVLTEEIAAPGARFRYRCMPAVCAVILKAAAPDVSR